MGKHFLTLDFASTSFQTLNIGYKHVFEPGKLSLGLVVPIESYPNSPVPTMDCHLERVQLAERLGFKAVWIRDVPFYVPSFGDAGQTFDPFVYLGFLAAQTYSIAIGVASTILPLRHPAHVAKAAATADVLSQGRLILGVASGDRPEEFPAVGVPYDSRSAAFRDSFSYIEEMYANWPRIENSYGSTKGEADLLPKPTAGRIPLLVTGGSQQDSTWLTQNGDGWMLYPRPAGVQKNVIKSWRAKLEEYERPNQPVLEPLYVNLTNRPDTPRTAIHLGFRLGAKTLVKYLQERQEIGVNHVAINLRFNQADIEGTLHQLAEHVLPEFCPA